MEKEIELTFGKPKDRWMEDLFFGELAICGLMKEFEKKGDQREMFERFKKQRFGPKDED